MRVFTALLRAALSAACLALLPSLTAAPARAEGLVPLMMGNGGASSWVKGCDKGQIAGKTKDGKAIPAKAFEMCTTLTEHVHPDTGKIMLNAILRHVKLDGQEKLNLSVSIRQGVKGASGAEIAVLPTDLWLKVEKKEKLDSDDESRLKAGTVKLAFDSCGQEGCTAATEPTPELIDMLKAGAGLMVRTVRTSGTPDSYPVSLAGFMQALSGPPMDMKAYKEARERLLKKIAARQKPKKAP